MTRRIVAIGGARVDEPALAAYVMALARGRRVCFLPTASGDSDEYIKSFYVTFRGCDPTHLELFQRTEQDLRPFLLAQDLTYVPRRTASV